MAEQKHIVGNWKMNGDPAMAKALASEVSAYAARLGAAHSIVLCPPAALLSSTLASIKGGVRLGAQDCHEAASGAYTGDISASTLKSCGVSHVIVGHSERRAGHKETSALVNAKAARAIESGLVPIICVGETDGERSAGKAEEIVGRQIVESLPKSLKKDGFLIAYEPVWAIGTGKTATTADITQMHTHIVNAAAKHTGLAPEAIYVLYGGSVKADNAKEILAAKGVAGVLVGGASLKADEFCRIIAAAG